jgi:serine protease Do
MSLEPNNTQHDTVLDALNPVDLNGDDFKEYNFDENIDSVNPTNHDNDTSANQDEGVASSHGDCIYPESNIVQDAKLEQVKTLKKGGFAKKILAAVVLGAVFGLTAGVAFNGVANISADGNNSILNGEVQIGTTSIVESPVGDLVSTSISTVAKSVMPSVVSITNLNIQEVEYFFFGTQRYETESSGSGIIIGENDAELLIVTNNHVIEGNKTLTVTFNDGESVEAVVKGSNAEMDIAVIAVRTTDMKEATLQEIKVATVGDSENLVVGEPTIAIGNALGYGQSVTSGIISALSRELDGFDTKLIQTDAAINPGNSGGALLNIKGEVIGINTAKLADNAIEGMGYAIPISEVKEIIEEMMARETREKVDVKDKGTLGIMCVDVNETAAKYYNMPAGAYINEVTEGGAADKAGISRGSIITKFDKTSVNSSTALVDLLAYYEAGETVEIEIAVPTPQGEYEKKTVSVTLERAKD